MNASYMRFWHPSQKEQQGIAFTLNSISTAITYPLEYVKTRIQIRAEGYGIRLSGSMGGYSGHKVFRQLHEAGGGMERMYTGFTTHYISRVGQLWIRNWLYYKSYYRRAPVKATNDLTWKEKAVISGICGAVAAVIMSPIEMLNVRAINDTAVPKEMRANYGSIYNGIAQVKKVGGNSALYVGCGGYAAKMFALNASMTGPYDFVNERLYTYFGLYECNRIFAMIVAAAFGTAASLPFDNIKTRMMKQQYDPSLNRINYRSSLDCLAKTLSHESAFSLWVGFVPMYYKMLFYCGFTVYMSEMMTDPLKRSAGLKEYEIYPE